MLDWQVIKTSRINFNFELEKKIGTKKSVVVFILIESVISLRNKLCGEFGYIQKHVKQCSPCADGPKLGVWGTSEGRSFACFFG